MLSGLEQRGRMDLGCGRGQGKKQHGMAHLQNPRSRSDQRRQGDSALQVARKFLVLTESSQF